MPSFVKFHSLLEGRYVTEFSYRYSHSKTGFVITSFILRCAMGAAGAVSEEARSKEVAELIERFAQNGIEAVDLSDDEFSKSHVRHLVGGRSTVKHERIFRFGRSLTDLLPDD